MASVIDSFKEVFGEQFSFFKIALLTIPVYYSYQIYTHAKGDLSGFWGFAIITAFFILGFMTKIANNVIKEKTIVLPSINPIFLAFSSIKATIALTPVVLASVLLANYICSSIHVLEWLDVTLKVFVWLIASAAIGLTFIMFAAKERILDAYNIKVLFKKMGDFLITIIFFIIQIVSVNAFTFGFIGYTLFILLGFGIFFDIFIAYAVTFNFAIIAHYLGQAHFELIGYED